MVSAICFEIPLSGTDRSQMEVIRSHVDSPQWPIQGSTQNQTYELDFLDDFGGRGRAGPLDRAFDPIGLRAWKWGSEWLQFRIKFGFWQLRLD